MPDSIDALLRRIKPHKRTARLSRRPDGQLPFIGDGAVQGPVILDSTVYIHVAQGRAPRGVLATLAAGGPHLHGAVCLGEIAVSLGRLDPGDDRTASRMAYLSDLLREAPAHRTRSPSNDDWIGAGILAGTAARLYDADDRDRLRFLNDCLLLFTGLREGATVLTANFRDFDPLTQLMDGAKVAFYRPT